MGQATVVLEKFLSMSNAGIVPDCPLLKELVRCMLAGDWDKIEEIIPSDMIKLIQATEGMGLLGEREPPALEELLKVANMEAKLREVMSWAPGDKEVEKTLLDFLKYRVAYIAGRFYDLEIGKRKWKRFFKKEMEKGTQ